LARRVGQPCDRFRTLDLVIEQTRAAADEFGAWWQTLGVDEQSA